MAGEYLHPGVFVKEKAAIPSIAGIGVSTGGFLGAAKKGPLDKARLIASWTDFVAKYGGYYKGLYLPISVKAFFDNGGARCYVSRVAGAGAAVADKDLKDSLLVASAATVKGSVDLFGGIDLSQGNYNEMAGDTIINLDVDSAGAVNIDVAAGAVDINSVTLVEIIAAINGAGFGVVAVDDGGFLRITSTTVGMASEVELSVLAPVVPRAAAFLAPLGTMNLAALNPGNFNVDFDLDGLGPVVVDVTGNFGATPGAYVLAAIVVNINNALVAAHGAGYAAFAAVLGTEILLTSPVAGGASRITLTDGPAGTSALLECFGVPEGIAPVTYLGGDSEALLEVMGLAEGVTHTFLGTAGATDIVKVEAVNEGDWGNNIGVTTQRWNTTLAQAFVSGGTEVFVASLRDVSKGDLVTLTDPATGNTGSGYVYDIDVATKKLTMTAAIILTNPMANLPIGSTVESSTAHRALTEFAAAAVVADAEIRVKAATGINVGSLILISDGTNTVFKVVTVVSGTLVKFGGTLGHNFAAGTLVATMEWNLYVYDEGSLVEFIEYLTLESTNEHDYIEKRVAGDGNESSYIVLTDLFLATCDDPEKCVPAPIVKAGLTGGLDGATPGDSDYIGSAAPPKSGIYLFDEIDGVNMISTPGITTVAVVGNGIDYCDGRKDCMYPAVTPLSDDEAQEAYDYRMFELNKNSSYAALYYPWLKIVDPEVSGNIKSVPPEGWIQGVYAAVAAEAGVHQAPANIVLRGVIGLTHDTVNGEQDILNPVGVNVIRSFPGEGIKVWGARTLWNVTDGRHYVNVRRLLMFIEESVEDGNRWAVFKLSDPSLWSRLEFSNSEFLRGLWRQGMLFPSTDAAKAFFVKCDEENNPETERKQGRLHILLGVNPPYPAEFIIITVALWDSGQEITEMIG